MAYANYEEATAAPTNYSMSEERKANYQNSTNYDVESLNDGTDEMPVTGADNGMVLADLRGKSYDDEQWDKLLDQMSVDDMVSLIGRRGDIRQLLLTQSKRQQQQIMTDLQQYIITIQVLQEALIHQK